MTTCTRAAAVSVNGIAWHFLTSQTATKCPSSHAHAFFLVLSLLTKLPTAPLLPRSVHWPMWNTPTPDIIPWGCRLFDLPFLQIFPPLSHINWVTSIAIHCCRSLHVNMEPQSSLPNDTSYLLENH